MASKPEKKGLQLVFPEFTLIQAKIVKMLKEKGPMSRDQICEEFGFKKHKVVRVDKYLLREKGIRYEQEYEQHNKRTTVYDNLVKLQKKTLIEKFSRSNGKRGRPKIYWRLKEV